MTSNNQDKASFQTDYVRLNVEQKDSVLLIELNRPEKYNAFDSLMIQELSKALTEYEQRDELRCALLYARGENFTTGLDLIELQDKVLSGIFDYPNDCIDPWGVSGMPRTKPYVVAVQGLCFTAGIELMLNADIVIASDDSRFAQMEVQRGLMPFGGATIRFVQTAGWQKAMLYLLTGDRFDAAKADAMGLVSQVVPKGEQFAVALKIATQISSHSAPLAVKRLLQSAKQGTEQDPKTAFANVLGYLPDLFLSQDFAEGVASLREKRPAQFQGK